MAGQGKGVLRIAIEDFFTTTKVGKWIAQWFKDFGEAQETAIYESYKNLPDKLLEWSKDITKALPQPGTGGDGNHQGEILTAGAFAGQVGMSAASSFMAPVMRLINYSMDKSIRSARFDPAIVGTLYFRNPDLATIFRSDLAELGWSDSRQAAYIEALMPLLAVADIDELVHRKIITEQDAKDEIKKQGFNDIQASQLLKIGEHIPGISDLVHMADRFAWDDEIARRFQYDTLYPVEVQDWVEKLGFEETGS